MEQEKTTGLLYFFDPLCGWCYGFSQVVKQLHEELKNDMYFKVICGGMMLGEREGKISVVASHIKDAYPRVEHLTGVKFGERFLQRILTPGEAYFSSRIPSLVFLTLNEYIPGKEVEHAEMLQHAIYFDGVMPNEPSEYIPYLEKAGIQNTEAFFEKMNLPETDLAFKDHVGFTKNSGIKGYPTLILGTGTEYFQLNQGYAPYQEIRALIREISGD